MTNLISVRAAQERILASFSPAPPETIPLERSLHRILYADVHALFDSPLFTNSSMDGFAVRSSDLLFASANRKITLNVTMDIPAGSVPTRILQVGEAARIMTGAPLPSGSDCVVPVEETDPAGGFQFQALSPTIQVGIPFKAEQNTRPQGMDFKKGRLILNAAHRLRPQDVGMLAALGFAEVQVYQRPKIAIFSSGDELVLPGADLQPGQIFDSNRFFLTALAEQLGAEVIRLTTARDEPRDVERILDLAVTMGANLIISSAGVSVGAFDYVRQVIEANGQLSFWRVNIRPGKPLAFGTYKSIPIFGLPGNPVSAFTGFLVFIQPVLHQWQGLPPFSRRSVQAVLDQDIESDGRESYFRAKLEVIDGISHVKLTGHQGSGNLFSFVEANALLVVPSGVKSLPTGERVETWVLDQFDL